MSSAAVNDKIVTWPKLKDPGVLLSTRHICFDSSIPNPWLTELQWHPHFYPLLNSTLHRGGIEHGVGWDNDVPSKPRVCGEMTSKMSLNSGLMCIYMYIYEQQ